MKKLVCIKKSEDAKIVPNLKFLKTRKEKRSKKWPNSTHLSDVEKGDRRRLSYSNSNYYLLKRQL